MKQALPWPRRATIRPATRWRESVSAPAWSPSWAARTSAISSRPENSCGNGSIPASRIRSSFWRRSSRTWERSCGCCSGGSLIEARAYRPSSLLDLGDFEFFLRPARDLDGDDVVALFPEEGLADRRLVRELVLERVGLGRADDLEFLRVAGFLVFDVDDRAEADLIGAQRLLVDHLGAAEFLLQLGDPRLEQGLFVLGVVVFGVLGDVAEFARLLDPSSYLPAFGRREELDFLFEFLQPLRGDDGLTHLTTSLWIGKGSLAGLPDLKKCPDAPNHGGTPGQEARDYSGGGRPARRASGRPVQAMAAGAASEPTSSRARGRSALRCSSSATSFGASIRSTYQGWNLRR